MGRPRIHDEETAEALLDAAERIVAADGPDALSMRRVADQAGTTTRAVYSLFESKEGLLVALGNRAFQMLGSWVNGYPRTDDPAADLVNSIVDNFRRWALEHPALFRIAFQRIGELPPQLTERFRPARLKALADLVEIVSRALGLEGGLTNPEVRDATIKSTPCARGWRSSSCVTDSHRTAPRRSGARPSWRSSAACRLRWPAPEIRSPPHHDAIEPTSMTAHFAALRRPPGGAVTQARAPHRGSCALAERSGHAWSRPLTGQEAWCRRPSSPRQTPRRAGACLGARHPQPWSWVHVTGAVDAFAKGYGLFSTHVPPLNATRSDRNSRTSGSKTVSSPGHVGREIAKLTVGQGVERGHIILVRCHHRFAVPHGTVVLVGERLWRV